MKNLAFRQKMRIVFTLAWRNLWRNHRRTLIMFAAITVGVWAMIFMTAMMRGMVDDMMYNGIRNLPGEVQIHHPGYRDDPSVNNSIEMPSGELLEMIEAPPVKAWSARVRVPAVIASERESRGITLLGVDPESELKTGFELENMQAGRFLQDPDDSGVVIGAKLAERLETRLGKRVVIMSQDPNNQIADRGFRIVGIYRAKLPSLEEIFVYTGRSTLQKMLGIDSRVSEIVLTGEDYRNVVNWFPRLQQAIDGGYEILPWYQLDAYLGGTLDMMDGFVLVWMLVIFIALSFGLVNTLIMAVYERVREIGLMQALGMRPRMIVWQVVTESFLLLLIGLLLGNSLALVTIIPLRDGIDISVVSQGMEMMGTSSVLYPALKLKDMLAANLVVISLGLLTSFLPAWQAVGYDPVEALNRN